MLGEIVWQDNGWPVFAGGRTPSLTEASPFGKKQEAPAPVDFADSFEDSKLGVAWQWDLKYPPTVKITDGQLHLWPSLTPSPAARTVLGVRVQKGDYTLTATIDRSGPAHEGIVIYGEDKSMLTLRIEHEELILAKTEKGESAQLAKAACPPSPKVHLRMTVREGHKFSFSASTDGKEWKAIGEEIDGAFIPPWDRAPRAGIFVSGKPSYVGKFDSVELRYERP
jgi:beta-xylosidase